MNPNIIPNESTVPCFAEKDVPHLDKTMGWDGCGLQI
jgi:hypothetical protein